MQLNLGSNIDPLPGFVNVDIGDYPGVDVRADLEKRWPFADQSVDRIYANDIVEHIRHCWEEPDPDSLERARSLSYRGDFYRAQSALIEAIGRPKRTYGVFHVMGEAWRVLKDGGTFAIRVPSTDGRGWAQDPTHVSYWNENTFWYFTKDHFRGLYPNATKGVWANRGIKTTPYQAGICWVEARLEAIHDDVETEED